MLQDGELFICVNLCAARSIGKGAILLDALLSHVVLTLRNGITSTVGAGVSSHIEASLVGLHNIDACALRIVTCHSPLLITPVIDSDKVKSSDTAAVNIFEVNVVRDSSTSNPRLESVVGSLVIHTLDHHTVIVGNGDASI